jgi:fructose transport system ATP-binding protein
MSAEPILTPRGLVKKFGRVVALDHADFDLYPNEILAVIGDNGAGKSTLIKALCGAVTEARAAGIETVYQNLALSPALSISDNMFLGREIRAPGILGRYFRATDQAKMQKFARDKLSELGLMTIQNINQPVETLSGGQREGVAVARAAAFARRLVIMDEPTAALGVKESRRVLELILDVKKRRLPIILVAQHAACVRGRRPHPHPSFGAADGRCRSAESDNVRHGCDDDRRDGAAGRCVAQ